MEENECCKNKNEGKKDGKGEIRNYIIAAIVGILLIMAFIQAYQISALKGSSPVTGSVVGGETYEEMMARMHPEQSQSSNTVNTGPGMVGGC